MDSVHSEDLILNKNKFNQEPNLTEKKKSGSVIKDNKILINKILENLRRDKENIISGFHKKSNNVSFAFPPSDTKDDGRSVQRTEEMQKLKVIKNNKIVESEVKTDANRSYVNNIEIVSLNDSRKEMSKKVLYEKLEELNQIKDTNFEDRNNRSENFEIAVKYQKESYQIDNINRSEKISLRNIMIDQNKKASGINLVPDSKEKADFADKEKKDTIIKTQEDTQGQSANKSKQRKKNHFSMSVPLSVDLFLSPNLSYRETSGSTDYRSDINSFENVKFNFAGGMRVNFELTERIKVGVGVSFNSYGENYTISKEKMAEKYQVNYKIYQDSFSVTHFDPVDTVKFHQAGKTKNHYNYLSIPLSASYLFKTGNVSFGITGGAAANFLLSASTSRVEFYSDSLTRVVGESSTDPNSPFRNFAISFFVNPIITYDVNDKWKLFVEPGFTYFINSVYKADYPLKRNLYAVEVKAGVRFRFN
jgi:hypothetical protein